MQSFLQSIGVGYTNVEVTVFIHGTGLGHPYITSSGRRSTIGSIAHLVGVMVIQRQEVEVSLVSKVTILSVPEPTGYLECLHFRVFYQYHWCWRHLTTYFNIYSFQSGFTSTRT